VKGRALLIDLDGVLYEGERAVPGGAAAIAWIRERGIPHLFLTNTTSRPRAFLVEKLGGLGVATSAEAILTPPVAADRWLAAQRSSRLVTDGVPPGALRRRMHFQKRASERDDYY